MSLWDSCSNLSGDNVRGYGIKFKSSIVTNSYHHHPAQDNPDALFWGLPFHGHFPISRFKKDLSAWTSPVLLARLWKPQSHITLGFLHLAMGLLLMGKWDIRAPTLWSSLTFFLCACFFSPVIWGLRHTDTRDGFLESLRMGMSQRTVLPDREGEINHQQCSSQRSFSEFCTSETRKGFRAVCPYPVWQNLRAPVSAEGIWGYQGSGW